MLAGKQAQFYCPNSVNGFVKVQIFPDGRTVRYALKQRIIEWGQIDPIQGFTSDTLSVNDPEVLVELNAVSENWRNQ